MKHLEEKLGEKLPPMRAEFRRELRLHLLQKAQFKKEKSKISFFPKFLNHFRQFSLVYGVVFVLMALSIFTNFKTPLSAQDVLAQALEKYDERGDIYHEKIIHERYKKGRLVESSMDENYFDQKGQFLQLIKNPQTEEVSTIYLSVVDDFGDRYYFDTPLPGFTTDPEGQEKALLYYQSEKIRCVSLIETADRIGQVSLIWVKNNPSNYSIKTASIWKDETLHQVLSSYYGPWERQQSNEERIRSLVAMQPEHYEMIEREGRHYYVFETHQDNEREIWSYLDAQTFRLTLQEIRYASGADILEKSTTVMEEYLNSKDYPNIFNPDRFPQLEISTNYIDAHEASPDYFLKESGCYDQRRQKVDLGILHQANQTALQDWFSRLDGMDFSLKARPNIEPAIEFPFELNEVIKPVEASLKKDYGETHAAWLFESDSSDSIDVYAVLEGQVLEVTEDEWNDGDGNTVVMAHQYEGNEFRTRYSHLGHIDVKEGEKIKQGEKIAEMGRSGRYAFLQGDKLHLHFELLLFTNKLNPQLLWPEINHNFIPHEN